VCVDR